MCLIPCLILCLAYVERKRRARRAVRTSRQRSALFSLPQREAELQRHDTLSEEDLQNVEARRRPRNTLGFALPAVRAPGEFVPPDDVDFIGRQLGLDPRI